MAYHHTVLKSKKNHLTLDELHLHEEVRDKINQLLEEFTYLEALSKLNIPIDNKILLHGHTGCGKTATAHAIGMALNKKIITINLGGLVSSRLGETAKNLSEIFKQASQDQAILFIDEFDFIGKLRDYDEKDSGEMKRLVNTLIQQIDHLSEHTLLICATNHIQIIDSALLRRFQIKLNYELPTEKALDRYYDSMLEQFPENVRHIERQYQISYAEAKDLIYQQIKSEVIQLEKDKKHLLFVYDLPNLPSLQKKLYSREIPGKEDCISNYRISEEGNHDVIATAENMPKGQILNKATKSLETNDQLNGVVFEISGRELMRTDLFLNPDFKRVSETTASGKQVWIYIAKNSR